MACAWRNFKIISSRPLFIIIFRPKILFFVTYSILTGQTKIEFVIYWVLRSFLDQDVIYDRPRTTCHWIGYVMLEILIPYGPFLLIGYGFFCLFFRDHTAKRIQTSSSFCIPEFKAIFFFFFAFIWLGFLSQNYWT